MSNYSYSVTVICPESKIGDLNHLSGVWGLSLADASYFGAPNYEKGANKYCVRHTVATSGLVSGLAAPLVRPGFDSMRYDEDGNEIGYSLDLTKAEAARGSIELFELVTDEEGAIQPQDYPTGKIVYAINVPTKTVLECFGLTKIETEI